MTLARWAFCQRPVSPPRALAEAARHSLRRRRCHQHHRCTPPPVGPGTRIPWRGGRRRPVEAWARHLRLGSARCRRRSVERARAAGWRRGAGVRRQSAAQSRAGRWRVDVVYDPIGRATFEASPDSLRPRVRWCSFGATQVLRRSHPQRREVRTKTTDDYATE